MSPSSVTKLSYTLGCIVAVANARWFKTSHDAQSWEPAKETAIGGATGLKADGWTPKPTAAPEANMDLAGMELFKREDDLRTCGYYSGYSSSPAVVCINQASCVVNTRNDVVGCCNEADVTDCMIATRCIESESASYYYSSDLDYTILCTSTDYPYCVTYSYDDYDLFSGYRALGCGADPGIRTVLYEIPAGTTGTSGDDTSITFAIQTTTAATRPSSASALAPGATVSDVGGDNPTDTTTPRPTPSSKSAPVGAIVGGVVGGVGGLALIAAGIFFLVRHSKKNGGNSSQGQQVMATTTTYPPGGPSPYGTQPTPMGQTSPQQFTGYPPAGGLAVMDNRTSVAPSYYPASPTKLAYESISNAAVSPSVSPGPQSPDPLFQNPAPVYTPSPTTTTGQQQPQFPPQAQQYQPYTQQHAAHELPTTRADGELRELA